MASEKQTAAIVGAGTIGLSWATLFAAHGLRVRISDPRHDLEDVVRATVRELSATLPGAAQDPEALLQLITVEADLETAVADADVIQENGPENLALKRELFVRIERAARQDALILSSASGLLPSQMSSAMREPGRLLVGHPFNPPHVIPLVEVVPGEHTTSAATTAAVDFYRAVGKRPVLLRKEIGGFVGNRLQAAVVQESVHLVEAGVVSLEDLDTVVTESLGPRWATVGPFEGLHLGGGPGGLRHLLEHLGPGMQRRWQDLGHPELTPETIQRLSQSSEERFAALPYEQHAEQRFREQLAVLGARANGNGHPTAETESVLPLLGGDFYGYEHLLSEPDRALLLSVREFVEREVAPLVDDHWGRAEFPYELIPKLAELDIVGLGYHRDDRPARSRLVSSFLTMELARVDASFATFFGVHSGLAMGSIVYCGSEEQKQRWLPDMFALKKIGAFALTEPHGGSDVALGLETTARRDGDEWVLNGAKRWIGNATFADYVVVWARDVDDDQVKGFVVEKGTPGFATTKMEGKLALRMVQNADITLEDCRVPEANRLQHASSFRDTSRVLRLTRGGVAWNAVGVSIGAYEAAVAYARTRKQFGKPIGSFQLIQDHLARMLGDITASLGMAVRVAQLQDAGACRDEQAALAKLYCTERMRDVVAHAREVFGGNGVLLENKVARFFNDAEALYSYEGTREVNTLIVGRSITGMGAFA